MDQKGTLNEEESLLIEVKKLRAELAVVRADNTALREEMKQFAADRVGVVALLESIRETKEAIATASAVSLGAIRSFMEALPGTITPDDIAKWTELALKHGPGVVGIHAEVREVSSEERYEQEGLTVWGGAAAKRHGQN